MLRRRKNDIVLPPPLPEMECPIRVQQLVMLGRNICFRIEEITKCETKEFGTIPNWIIKGTAFYQIPKNSTDILIERSVDASKRNIYTVSYNRYGAKYKEPVERVWIASDTDEHARRYLLRYEVMNVIPNFKTEF